ncbi:protein of unknown function [Xenorhabdus doucetiae]|uniref:Uncharacterized protein n=1 Tax=Xenorhabdus doucetiae TaxID=351671 RepID=A0A068QXS8_9GAMM|nr:protein of unknown function [Xenorhabdus doucetiae]
MFVSQISNIKTQHSRFTPLHPDSEQGMVFSSHTIFSYKKQTQTPL